MSGDLNRPSDSPESEDAANRRRILIGSQKDPAAYRPKRSRDWKPVEEPKPEGGSAEPQAAAAPPPELPVGGQVPSTQDPVLSTEPATPPVPSPISAAPPTTPEPPALDERAAHEPAADEPAADETVADEAIEDFPVPRLRPPADLDEEAEEALDDASLEDLLAGSDAISRQPTLELESQHIGRVLAVRRDDVFIELGGREQGVVSLRQLPQPPEPGMQVPVIVKRYDPDEGLYELSVPNRATAVADWGDLSDGMLVDAQVTGHNSGGLECEVNHIRGFIPVSQVSLYRVENLEEFVGQRFTCLVTEANPQRRNLVLSRRAVLEREKEDARQRVLESLAVGQVYDGVVRKLMDFGAFVDIGGVDGLLHVSQLSWARVKHPSDVLQEGQPIRVRVNKIDPATGKISFGYRDLLENPWTQAASKYPVNSVVRGTVTKIMEFGAFVQLEPGIEGLVHISELSPKRVWRATDIVNEGQEVDAVVLAIDVENQRISLSMKLLAKQAEPAKKEEPEAEAAPPPPPARKKPSAPLKGGLGRIAGGEQFGLKW